MTNQSADLLAFPKDKIVREFPNVDIRAKLDSLGTKNVADSIVEDLSTTVLIELSDGGIDTSLETFSKDFSVLVSMMSALIYRALEIEHPMHKFIDENVSLIEPEDSKEDE